MNEKTKNKIDQPELTEDPKEEKKEVDAKTAEVEVENTSKEEAKKVESEATEKDTVKRDISISYDTFFNERNFWVVMVITIGVLGVLAVASRF